MSITVLTCTMLLFSLPMILLIFSLHLFKTLLSNYQSVPIEREIKGWQKYVSINIFTSARTRPP